MSKELIQIQIQNSSPQVFGRSTGEYHKFDCIYVIEIENEIFLFACCLFGTK